MYYYFIILFKIFQSFRFPSFPFSKKDFTTHSKEDIIYINRNLCIQFYSCGHTLYNKPTRKYSRKIASNDCILLKFYKPVVIFSEILSYTRCQTFVSIRYFDKYNYGAHSHMAIGSTKSEHKI